MLAQKIPTTALLINNAETWNSLYFQDLNFFQNQLVDDFMLRFLFMAYIKSQRNWLHRFSIKKYMGSYFIQLFCISGTQKKRNFPIVFNYNKINSKLVKLQVNDSVWQKNKNKISPKFYWKKYLGQMLPKKVITNLNTKTNWKVLSFITNQKAMSLTMFNRWKSNLKYKMEKHKRFKNMSKMRFTKSIAKIVTGSIVYNQKRKLHKMKVSNNLINMVNTLHSVNLPKYTLNMNMQTLKSNISNKPYKLLQFSLKWVKKFFRRRTRKWNWAIMWWLKKWSHKLRFKKNMKKRLQMLQMYMMSAKSFTKMNCFIHYKVSSWLRRGYKMITYYMIFERNRKPYLPQVLVATHYAISQGAPAVLTDLCRLYLTELTKHKQFLKCVHVALRYFLALQGLLVINPASYCTGARIKLVGKIDGRNRKGSINFLLGRIRTGSVFSTICYDQATIITRYGSLHVHIWMSFKYYNKSKNKSIN